jgi:hypothetical protein
MARSPDGALAVEAEADAVERPQPETAPAGLVGAGKLFPRQ